MSGDQNVWRVYVTVAGDSPYDSTGFVIVARDTAPIQATLTSELGGGAPTVTDNSLTLIHQRTETDTIDEDTSGSGVDIEGVKHIDGTIIFSTDVSFNTTLLSTATGANKTISFPNASGIVAIDPTTTKGDLIARNGTVLTRLPVGADTYVLTADSAESTGLKWAVGGSGGGGSVDVLLPFSYNSNNTADSSGYTTVSSFIFPGSSTFSGTTIKVVARIDASGSATYDIKLQDITNSMTIATLATQSNSTDAILDLGSLSNIPSEESIFEVQIKLNGGTATDIATLSSVQVKGTYIPGTLLLSTSYEQDNKTTNASYTTLGTFVYPGSSSFTMTSVKMISRMDSGPTSYDIRLQDITNANTIGESSGNVNTTDSIVDLGSLSSIPSSEAIFEFQVRRVGGDASHNIYLTAGHIGSGSTTATEGGGVRHASGVIEFSTLGSNYTSLVSSASGTNKTITLPNETGTVALERLTTVGDLLGHNGTNTIRVPVGINDYVLTADSGEAAGYKWAEIPGSSGRVTHSSGNIVFDTDDSFQTTLKSTASGADVSISFPNESGNVALQRLTTVGDILGHNGTNTLRVPVGASGYVLTVDSGEAAGFKWAAAAGGDDGGVTHSSGNIVFNSDASFNTTLVSSADGANKTITFPNSSGTVALNPTTTKGDIIANNGTMLARLPVGTDAFVLTADSAEATGLKWAVAGTGSGTASEIVLPYSYNSDNTTNSSGYTTLSSFIFPGSASFSGTTVKVVARIEASGSATYDLRLEDITNTNTLATLTTQSNSTDAILDMGSLISIPSGQSIFEIQAKKNGGTATDTVTLSSVQVKGIYIPGSLLITTSYEQDNKTTNTTYTSLGTFVYPGSSSFTMTAARIISRMDSGPTSYSARLLDVTNALVIAENTGLTNTIDSIVDLGTLSNIPSGEAIFEYQVKRVSGDASNNIYLTAGHITSGSTTATEEGGVRHASGVIEFSTLSSNYTSLVSSASGTDKTITFPNETGTVALERLTTVGDLLGHNGTNTLRVPVGASGYVLTVDSGESAGFKWAPAAGGDDAGVTHSSGNIVFNSDASFNTTLVSSADGANKTITFPNSSGIVALDPTTTKGDLLANNGTMLTRLPVGTDAFVLTADSAEATGLKWAVAGTGSGTASEIVLPFSYNSENTTDSSGYTALSTFVYPGSASFTGTTVKVVARIEASGSATYDIRLEDITNANTLATLTTQSNSTDAILDLGSLSNIPTGQSILEVQVKKNGGTATDTVTLSSVQVKGIYIPGSLLISTSYEQDNKTTNTTYTALGTFVYPGSSSFTMTAAKIISRMDSGVTSYSARLFDITNSNTIAENTGITNSGDAIVDLGTLSNIPSGEAIFEYQIKRVGGTGTDNIYLTAGHITSGSTTATEEGGVRHASGVIEFSTLGSNYTSLVSSASGTDKTITFPNETGTVALEKLTTKGDLLGHNGTNTLRVPVGASGYVLTVDSGEAAGFKWAVAAGSTGGVSHSSGNIVFDTDASFNTTLVSSADGTDKTITFPNETGTVALNPTTTKGDILANNGTMLTRLPVGNDTFVLTANSSEATGLKWSVIPGASGSVVLPFTFKESVDSSGYTILSSVIFPGSLVSNITSAKVISRMDSGPTSYDIRLYDFTNSNTIVESSGNVGIVDSIVSLGTLSSVPSSEAIFEVHARRVGGSPGDNVYVSALYLS